MMTRLLDGLVSVAEFFIRGFLFALFMALVLALLLGVLMGIVWVAGSGHPILAIFLALLGLGLLFSLLLEGLFN